jgi:hypothetical protein
MPMHIHIYIHIHIDIHIPCQTMATEAVFSASPLAHIYSHACARARVLALTYALDHACTLARGNTLSNL